MFKITVLLGGHLRAEAKEGPAERILEFPDRAVIDDVVAALELPPERVGMIMLNGKGAPARTPLRNGDRVALFPPELRYNTFVSLYFRTDFVESRNDPDDEPSSA